MKPKGEGKPEESALERSRSFRRRQFAAQEEEAIVPRAVVERDARALRGNYEAIRELVPGQAILPMIKADGYGHGAEWVAGVLLESPDLYGFGVATLEEGADLRRALGARARGVRIIVFSGCAPWSDEKGQFCERHSLVPVIATDADWQAFARGGWPSRIAYELKFNTGMNRLGLSPGLARGVVKTLKAIQGGGADAHPSGILSHLAMSEDPDCRLSRLQLERFIALKSELAGAFPSSQFHLANSGGIWNQKQLGLQGLTDAVRPGLSLYGVAPWAGAPERGLVPVLTFKAGVVAVHALKPGEGIGYGATFRVSSRGEPVYAAVLSAGYADGVSRMLSNQGHAWLGGGPTRFLGIVSMDLCAVTAGPGTRVGDQAELLGPHVDIWAQARAAGTIPYELLTSLSGRVKRISR